MTNAEKKQIRDCRKNGMGYKQIATLLNLSVNTIKTFCRRNNLTEEGMKPSTVCECCGANIQQTEKRKKKRFCSDACRMKWWNSHPEKVRRKAIYHYSCCHCHKPFTVYGNDHRKFCSWNCYIEHRYGGKTNERRKNTRITTE